LLEGERNHGAKLLAARRTANLFSAQPVFGLALAKLWLGETLHWGQLWGSVAIVLGLVVGLSRQVKTATDEPQ